MNMQLRQDRFAKANIRPVLKPDLMDEVVAGILWLSLDLPEDVSRRQMEKLAHHLVERIRANDEPGVLEQDFALLLLRQFSKPPKFAAIRDVIQRVMNAVNGF